MERFSPRKSHRRKNLEYRDTVGDMNAFIDEVRQRQWGYHKLRHAKPRCVARRDSRPPAFQISEQRFVRSSLLKHLLRADQ